MKTIEFETELHGDKRLTIPQRLASDCRPTGERR
jgi:hypothetical protein